jgi:hypothetical protein
MRQSKTIATMMLKVGGCGERGLFLEHRGVLGWYSLSLVLRVGGLLDVRIRRWYSRSRLKFDWVLFCLGIGLECREYD